MEKSKWVYMPHAGHFIAGDSCRFRLNTYVGKYIVSTVGEYITDRGDEEELGFDRKYETMVFEAHKSENKCCPYEIDASKEVEMVGYNTAGDAYEGHQKLCEKWSKD